MQILLFLVVEDPNIKFRFLSSQNVEWPDQLSPYFTFMIYITLKCIYGNDKNITIFHHKVRDRESFSIGFAWVDRQFKVFNVV